MAVEVLASANPEPLRISLRIAAVRQSITVSASGEYAVPDASGATKTDTPIMEPINKPSVSTKRSKT